ncbi:DUF2163 domain-containing protein [Tabrizicola sp. BL-A-41-H6]|uniref:DUF2163 domain-containing protein n=1 Tax=Tabrizicola sp. BL-A-41-H6 TaxID=3421107 RepID=UPI003D67916E
MSAAALHAHLGSGATTVCRAWTVVRPDGTVLGFTDHDRDLVIEGVVCRADTGMTARALQQTTGLSVDNSEAVGALSDASVTEADLLAGRYDGAEVRAWLVNWANPDERIEQFRGALGEIVRAGGSFRAELRGLSDALNRPQGFAYQSGCSAVLGDSRCRFDTGQPGYFAQRVVETVEDGRSFRFASFAGFDDRWFEYGRFEVLSGLAAGLVGVVRADRQEGAGRRIDLWQSIPAEIATGDSVRIIAGCNKASDTCRTKFSNFMNFRGFPHIPGEDWLTSYPVSGSAKTGGSLVRQSGGPTA